MPSYEVHKWDECEGLMFIGCSVSRQQIHIHSSCCARAWKYSPHGGPASCESKRQVWDFIITTSIKSCFMQRCQGMPCREVVLIFSYWSTIPEGAVANVITHRSQSLVVHNIPCQFTSSQSLLILLLFDPSPVATACYGRHHASHLM